MQAFNFPPENTKGILEDTGANSPNRFPGKPVEALESTPEREAVERHEQAATLKPSHC
jgi:hypothetical protein